MEDRQAGLQRDRDLDARRQSQSLCAAPLLFGDELAGKPAQAAALVRGQVAEKGQAGFGFVPQLRGDFEASGLPLPPPRRQAGDHGRRRVLSQMPAKIRQMPTA